MSNHGDSQLSAGWPKRDLRAEGRTATVFRPVLFETDEFAGFCLVRNLSSNGMRGQVYTSFAEGLAVTVQFSPERIVQGTIIWCKDEHVGVQFDEPVDVEQVLSDLARKLVEGKINRAPRLQIECKAEVVIGDRTLSILLQDISQRGIKATASFLKPGDEVWVRLEGLQRKAVVRWMQGGTAGLNFIRPISFDELAQWVIGQQSGRQFVETRELPSVRLDRVARAPLDGAVEAGRGGGPTRLTRSPTCQALP